MNYFDICLFKQILIFRTNKCVQMSIQYTVQGFELTTFGTESPPITTRP